MINARGLLAGFGTQNAQVAAGGSTSMPTDTSALTEEYDGSSWSAATAMPTAIRVGARAGTTAHAGLVFGGSNGAKTQEYDGTNWSAGGNAITAAIAAGGGGESNAAVKIGGELGALQTCVEHYDGTSWSTATAYPLVTCAVQFTGLQNAGLAFGGATFPSPSDDTLDNTYIYDGTSLDQLVPFQVLEQKIEFLALPQSLPAVNKTLSASSPLVALLSKAVGNAVAADHAVPLYCS